MESAFEFAHLFGKEDLKNRDSGGCGMARLVNNWDPLEKVKPEIALQRTICRLLCANCHKVVDTDAANALKAKIRAARTKLWGFKL